jgi:hypothetical protein
VDRVAGSEQGGDEQAPVGLDADHHLLGFVGMLAEQGVQPGHALETIGDPACSEYLAVFVEDAHVVVRLGPVDTHEDHRSTSSVPREPLEGGRGELMDQCSDRHVTPAAISTVLADHRGHDLGVGLRWSG